MELRLKFINKIPYHPFQFLLCKIRLLILLFFMIFFLFNFTLSIEKIQNNKKLRFIQNTSLEYNTNNNLVEEKQSDYIDENFKYFFNNNSYIKFNETTKISSNISINTHTYVELLDPNNYKHFNFDLNENLKEFLKEFYQNDLNLLYKDNDYKNYVNNTYKKRTIIIAVDGLVQSCIDFRKYGAFSYLMDNGSYNLKIRSTTEGFSGPGWSSLLCSQNSKETGIVNNNWTAPWLNNEIKKNYDYSTPINGLDKSFPCLFDELKRKNSKIKNFFYSSWDFFSKNFGNRAYPDSIDIYVDCLVTNPLQFIQYSNCDEFSLAKTKNLVLKDFDVYFQYLTVLDVAGHTFGFCSNQYASRLENLNKMLLELFDYLRVLNILDKINIILTSDHGVDKNLMAHGHDKNDGNLLVPLFMMGPDFKKNKKLESNISTVDLAPTIAKILDVQPSKFWKGTAIDEALKRDLINVSNIINQTSLLFMECFLINYNFNLILILVVFLI